MRKYYTRPCNFYYGDYARKLIRKKKALSLAGNQNIAFDQLEIFKRKKRRIIQSNIYSITSIKTLPKEIQLTIRTDIKKLLLKEKMFVELNSVVFILWVFSM